MANTGTFTPDNLLAGGFPLVTGTRIVAAGAGGR
jgi:hypothetical protein